MISFLYNFALLLIGIAAAPKLLWNAIFQGKYRASFKERFGFGLPELPKDKKGPVIWIHAISLGETRAMIPLFQILRNKLPNAAIFISSITETGYTEAKRSLKGADGYFYLPLDFSWIIKKTVKKLQPDLLILCEGDFWYELLKTIKKRGASCLLVNGKISARSTGRFLKIPFFSKPLFNYIDAFCVQSFRHAERFRQLGIGKNKIAITGNLKLDADPVFLSAEEKKRWKEDLNISPQERVVVMGSTHPHEEALLLQELQKVWKKIPDLKVVIVPRHPERFSALSNQLPEWGYPTITYSKRGQKLGNEKVILIDAMGLLQTLYQLADVAIVGGSFVKGIGGHNIFEPVQYGVPVVFGKHMESQLDLANLVLEWNAGIQTTTSDLSNFLLNLLESPEKHEAFSKAAFHSASEVRGSTQRTVEVLEKYLP